MTNHGGESMRKYRIVLAICVIVCCSCSKEYNKMLFSKGPSWEFEIEDVMVPARNEVLFANIEEYLLEPFPSSKSSISDDRDIPFKSLLDTKHRETIEINGHSFLQIPFTSNTEAFFARISGIAESSTAVDSLSRINKFLIVIDQNTENEVSMVATMLSKPEYFEITKDISFIRKPNYSGIILFSDIDGSLFEVKSYENGIIVSSTVLLPDEIENYEGVEYISVIEGGTKVVEYSDNIRASICIAKKDTKKVNEKDESNSIPDVPTVGNSDRGGGGGSVSGDGSQFEKLTELKGESKLARKKDAVSIGQYTVSTYANNYKKGSVPASREYEAGSKVNIRVSPYGGCYFHHWTGDFAGLSMNIMVTVNHDISATAYFYSFEESVVVPCVDLANSKANPLVSPMSIAPCLNEDGNGSGVTGGMWGWTRSGGRKFHDGIDLYAEPGTEVFPCLMVL